MQLGIQRIQKLHANDLNLVKAPKKQPAAELRGWNGQSTPILRMSRMRPCNLKIFRILGERYRNRQKAVNEQVTDLIVIECSLPRLWLPRSTDEVQSILNRAAGENRPRDRAFTV